MIKTISRYYFTIRDLKWIQIRYQLIKKIRSILRLDRFKYTINTREGNLLTYELGPYSSLSYSDEQTFTFLSTTYKFENVIDWNYSSFGKLWTYNLSYFDFLNQKGVDTEKGLSLIHDFMSKSYDVIDGNEAYPTSLRIINWIKFISKNKVESDTIDQHLYAQSVHLSKNLEFHLLGNHLLENAFALLWSAHYFRDENFLKLGRQIIDEQLAEQILADGGHFEKSPMYHLVIFSRLLDLINLLQSNESFGLTKWKAELKDYAAKMSSWITNIRFQNGAIPQVNDSTADASASYQAVITYANKLGVKAFELPLQESGYRMIKNEGFELFVDIGDVGPEYIPGHAHSDTFSFLLHHNAKPIIVEPGISTYEKNKRRHLERSTASHNTAMVKGYEQSDVWGGFRVGRKAKVKNVLERKGYLEASHDGYHFFGVTHKRIFEHGCEQLAITDHLDTDKSCQSSLHFHPDVIPVLKGFELKVDDLVINFEHASSVRLEEYEYAQGFNQRQKATKVVVSFNQTLSTYIRIV